VRRREIVELLALLPTQHVQQNVGEWETLDITSLAKAHEMWTKPRRCGLHQRPLRNVGQSARVDRTKCNSLRDMRCGVTPRKRESVAFQNCGKENIRNSLGIGIGGSQTHAK